MLEAAENLIADALLAELKKINANREPDKWLSSPRTIVRGFTIAGLALPRPVLMVQVSGWNDTPQTFGQHESVMQIGVNMLVDLSDADSDLIRLKRDVVKAAALAETLGGLVHYIFPLSYEPQIQVMEQAGLGAATLLFETRYRWSHDAP